MKRLVIIQDILEARSFLRHYRKNPEWRADELVLFVPDPESFRFLQSVPGLKPLEASVYDRTSEQDNVSPTAYDLAARWTELADGHHSYVYRGVSLPLVIQREMTYFWVGLLRSIHIFNELCRRTGPDEIWISRNPRQDLFFYAPSNYSHFSSICRASGSHQKKVREFAFFPQEQANSLCESMIRKTLFACGGYWTRQELKRTPRLRSCQFTALLKDAAAAVSGLFFQLYQNLRGSRSGSAVLISSSLAHIKPVIQAVQTNTALRIDYLREVFAPRQAFQMMKEGILFRSLPQSFSVRSKEATTPFSEIIADAWGYEEFESVDIVQASRQRLNFLITRYFPQIAGLVDAVHAFLDTHVYKGLAGEEDVCVFNKVLFEVAAQKGIQSVVVQHGAVGLPIGFVPLSASFFAAWGDFSKDRLLAWGVPKDRVVVTGNPAYDWLLHASLESRTAELASRYHIDPARPAVLVAMFPFRDYSSTDFPEVSFSRESYLESLKEIIKGLKPFQHYQIILKLHPRDSGAKKCEEIIKASGCGNIVLVQEGRILEWAPLCRAAVSFFSSSVMDLIASRTPLVMLDITGNVERTRSIFPVEVPIIAARAEAITTTLGPLLEGKAQPLDEAETHRYIYKLDGKAAQRIAALLCGENKTSKSAAPKEELNLREATLEDARLLLDWRNEPLSRKNSIQTEEIQLSGHLEWLQRTLKDRRVKIFIVMLAGNAVGDLRFEYSQGCVEFSWSVDHRYRGRGLGTRILEKAIETAGPGIEKKCRIKSDNIPSIKNALSAGFRLTGREEPNIQIYSRDN